MTEHNNLRNQDRILHALFCLSRATLPIDVAALADSTSLTELQVTPALLALGKAGLVDTARLRLTMLGLMKATALTSDLGGTAPVAQKLGRNFAPIKAEPIAAGSVPPGPLSSAPQGPLPARAGNQASDLAGLEPESRLHS